MIQLTHNPQQAPARALLELLTEHPELPTLTWDIARDGILRGHLHGVNVTREADAWAAALDYDLGSAIGYRFNKADRAFQTIYTMWRGVELSLAFYSEEPAHVTALLAAVAA